MMQKIFIKDFNVDNKGAKDSTLGFFEAIQRLKTLPKSIEKKLILEQGVYRISKENSVQKVIHTSNLDSALYPEKTFGLYFEDISNLTIEGNGAFLLFEGDMSALAFVNCQNIIFKNLSWDFNRPTASEMEVIAILQQGKVIDFKLPQNCDYIIDGRNIIWLSEKDSKGNYYWKEINAHDNYGIYVRYPEHKMVRQYFPKQSPFEGLVSIEKLDDKIVRFRYLDKPRIEPKIGMIYQFVSNKKRPNPGALIYESKNITFDNIDIGYMHGFGLLVQMCEDVYFKSVKIESLRSDRTVSSYVDGIHVSGAKGEIVIDSCVFSNTLDDGVNVHGTYMRLVALQNDEIELEYVHHQQAGFPQYHIGDRVVFYNRKNLEPLFEGRSYQVIELENPTNERLKTAKIKLDTMPIFDQYDLNLSDIVCENLTYNPKLKILNSEFSYQSTRCALVSSNQEVLIKANSFLRPSMSALFFSNDSNEWYESGRINDLTIEDNYFEIMDIGRTSWKDAPAIYFYPVTSEPDQVEAVFKNIKIQNNKFMMYADQVLIEHATENLLFVNNEFINMRD